MFKFLGLRIFWILIFVWRIANKNFLPVFRLYLHSHNCFLCCAKAFEFDAIPLVNSCYCVPELLESCSEGNCLCPYPEVFSLCFSLVVSNFQVLQEKVWSIFTWFWYGVRDRNIVSVSYMWISNFSSNSFWRGSLWLLCQESNGYSSVGLFLDLLFYSRSLVLCQYYAGVVKMAPLCNLKSRIFTLLILLFLLRIALALQVILCSQMNFRILFLFLRIMSVDFCIKSFDYF
jgi:hypothetical protein